MLSEIEPRSCLLTEADVFIRKFQQTDIGMLIIFTKAKPAIWKSLTTRESISEKQI